MMKMIALLMMAMSVAGATEYKDFQPAASSVTFVSKQMGVPVEGRFKKFAAQIAFDPNKPEQSTAKIEIEMASIDTGSAEANSEVATAGWFNSKTFPQANFVSGGLKKIDATHFQAVGKLTIKGKTHDVVAPFTANQQADRIVLEGNLPIRRGDFAIGSGMWADPDVVAEEVQIRFRLIVAAPSSSTQPKKGK
jgi:polyisoprenoid-binding protein YceI